MRLSAFQFELRRLLEGERPGEFCVPIVQEVSTILGETVHKTGFGGDLLVLTTIRQVLTNWCVATILGSQCQLPQAGLPFPQPAGPVDPDA